MKQAIRNQLTSLVFGLNPVRHAIADTMAEVSIGYPESPLSEPGGRASHGPQAGERAPIRAGEAPVGAGSEPRFALFAEEDEGDGAAAALLARYPGLIERGLRRPFHPDGLWLVRPDGYVAVATETGDWKRVSEYLERLAAG